MRAVRAFLVAALLLTLTTACSSSRGPSVAPSVELQDCAAFHKCTETAAVALSEEEETEQIELARMAVALELGREITTQPPAVVYVPCPFRVRNSNFGDQCAAGVCRWRQGYIQVMTFQPERTALLVWWESRNYFYCWADECARAI